MDASSSPSLSALPLDVIEAVLQRHAANVRDGSVVVTEDMGYIAHEAAGASRAAAIVAPAASQRVFLESARAQIRKLRVPPDGPDGLRLGGVLPKFPNVGEVNLARMRPSDLSATISDVSAADARRIGTLDISQCSLDDATAVDEIVRTFGRLAHLKVGCNRIRTSWLAPLAGTLRRLDIASNRDRYADMNQKNVEDLVDALPFLEHLDMGYADIRDIGPLARLTSLRTLDLTNNQIRDVAPLAALTALTRLKLWSNEIVDLSPLSALDRLVDLDIGANSSYDPHGNYRSITDLAPLRALTALTRLRVFALTLVSDVSPLAHLTNLKELLLSGSRSLGDGAGISPLSSLTALTSLVIFDSGIRDVAALASLTRLVSLDISCNASGDGLCARSGALTGLTALEALRIRNCAIRSELSPHAFSALRRLKRLDLSSNGAAPWGTSLAPLADSLPASLTSLELAACRIEDAAPLARLTNLKSLNLSRNLIRDVAPLAALTNLYHLNLRGNDLARDFAPLEALARTGCVDR